MRLVIVQDLWCRQPSGDGHLHSGYPIKPFALLPKTWLFFWRVLFGERCASLVIAARQQDVSLPVLEAIIPSNQRQIDKAVELLTLTGKRKVGMLGLSFKSNTDDLRESPALELAERLIGKGFELSIYVQEVSLSQIYGSNREYIEKMLPHIGSLIKPSLGETVEQAEAVIITKRLSSQESHDLLTFLTPAHVVVDLVRVDCVAVTPRSKSWVRNCTTCAT